VKVLVAVYSHTGDAMNGNHQKIRETWGKHLGPWSLRFMIGHRDAPGWQQAPDEVLLGGQANMHCGDWLSWNSYYQALTIEMLRYSLEQGYDFTFLACNDTFVIPSKLKATAFEKYDCSGIFYPNDGRAPLGETFDEPFYKRQAYVYPDAGTGWFMSRKAAEIIVRSRQEDYFGTSDQYVGQVLGPLIKSGEVKAANLENFHHVAAWHYREEDVAKPTGYPCGSNWMFEMYTRHGG
jgi:hypothetical protein